MANRAVLLDAGTGSDDYIVECPEAWVLTAGRALSGLKKGEVVYGTANRTRADVQRLASDMYANGSWPKGFLKPVRVSDCRNHRQIVFRGRTGV